MGNRKTKAVAVAALTLLLAVAVAVLAGVGAANRGHGKSAGSAQYQYGTSAGNQYGLHRQPVCDDGHTLRLPAPALRSWLAHHPHDHLGACTPTAPRQQTAPTQHGNSGNTGKSGDAATTLPAQANGNANGHRR